jgi:hypothetical protein
MRDCVARPAGARRFWCHRGCGDSWDTDPRLTVACPTCRAAAGVGCHRPSEHAGHFVQPHAARRALAWARNPCSCLQLWEEAQAGAVPEAPTGTQLSLLEGA